MKSGNDTKFKADRSAIATWLTHEEKAQFKSLAEKKGQTVARFLGDMVRARLRRAQG